MKPIIAITEAFSMQPGTWRVGSRLSDQLEELVTLDKIEYEFVDLPRGGHLQKKEQEYTGRLVGINSKGEVVFRILESSVNIFYC